MRVAVIGCGPSGLTTIKQLADEGHEVTCFEKSSGIGGIWYRNSNDADEMKVFDSLVLTVSIKMMAYSDFPHKGDRVFYTHKEYLAYLNAYADKYGLHKHVRLNSPVVEVRKGDSSKWIVTVTSNGEKEDHPFDAVAICSGPFQQPSLDVSDLGKFTGDVVHSYKYRNADSELFRNKRVLVVGLAESGADLLREVSDVASACTLAIRDYSFLLPRLERGRYATDSLTVRSFIYETYVRAPVFDMHIGLPMAAISGDTILERALFMNAMRLYGIAHAAKAGLSKLAGRPSREDDRDPPQWRQLTKNFLGEDAHPRKVDIGTEWNEEHLAAIEEWNRRSHPQQIIFCKNASFIPNIVNGKIQINDTGIDKIQGKQVTFRNGETREVDTILLCTGFKREFSVLGKDVAVRDNNVRNLYKHAFHPDHEGTLAYIGFVRPYTGGIPICSEMQARYFALLCSGKLRLPADVQLRIQKEKAWEELHTAYSPRHSDAIPSQFLFLDGIAKEIGCLMSVKELVRSPKLLVKHWFAPFNQACYRLTGPHAMPDEARQDLLSDDPGPRSGPRAVFAASALSLLPHFIAGMPLRRLFSGEDPRDVAPRGPHAGRKHALSPALRPDARSNARSKPVARGSTARNVEKGEPPHAPPNGDGKHSESSHVRREG